MSVVATGSVSQANLTGSSYLYSDTGTGYGTIISRILTVYDANGVVLGSPYNMGTSLTQLISLTKDMALTFVCVVTDNTGIYTATVIYDAIGYYTAQALDIIAAKGCNCDCQELDNLLWGEINIVNAARFSISDLLPSAQFCLDTANTWINNPY